MLKAIQITARYTLCWRGFAGILPIVGVYTIGKLRFFDFGPLSLVREL